MTLVIRKHKHTPCPRLGSTLSLLRRTTLIIHCGLTHKLQCNCPHSTGNSVTVKWLRSIHWCFKLIVLQTKQKERITHHALHATSAPKLLRVKHRNKAQRSGTERMPHSPSLLCDLAAQTWLTLARLRSAPTSSTPGGRWGPAQTPPGSLPPVPRGHHRAGAAWTSRWGQQGNPGSSACQAAPQGGDLGLRGGAQQPGGRTWESGESGPAGEWKGRRALWLGCEDLTQQASRAGSR